MEDRATDTHRKLSTNGYDVATKMNVFRDKNISKEDLFSLIAEKYSIKIELLSNCNTITDILRVINR